MKSRNYNLELPEPDELRRKPGLNRWIFYDVFEENLITRYFWKRETATEKTGKEKNTRKNAAPINKALTKN